MHSKMHEEIRFSSWKISALANIREKWPLLQTIVPREGRYTSAVLHLNHSPLVLKITWIWHCQWVEMLSAECGSYLWPLCQAFSCHRSSLSCQNSPQPGSTGWVDRLQQRWQHDDSLLKYPATHKNAPLK